MKKRTADPWMPAPAYARTLKGLGVNLLVRDIEASLPFHRQVLGAELVYADPDFAMLRGCGAEWMLHADHTYDKHPLFGSLTADLPRGKTNHQSNDDHRCGTQVARSRSGRCRGGGARHGNDRPGQRHE